MNPFQRLPNLPGPIQSAEDVPKSLGCEKLHLYESVELPFERTRIAIGEVYLYGGDYIQIEQIIAAKEPPLGTDAVGIVAVRLLRTSRTKLSFLLNEEWTDHLIGPFDWNEGNQGKLN